LPYLAGMSIDFGHLVDPSTGLGALVYAVVFLIGATIASRLIRAATHRYLLASEHRGMDRGTVMFLSQLASVGVFLIALVLYSHLVPALEHLGTALLTGVSLASIVIGLAAQSTLGNLIAGFAILLYHPVRIGDRVQISAPSGPTEGTVESLSLGYTVILVEDGRRLIVPNSTMASSVTVNLNEQRKA
jgi:small-conductance mechanosensitive channel